MTSSSTVYRGERVQMTLSKFQFQIYVFLLLLSQFYPNNDDSRNDCFEHLFKEYAIYAMAPNDKGASPIVVRTFVKKMCAFNLQTEGKCFNLCCFFRQFSKKPEIFSCCPRFHAKFVSPPLYQHPADVLEFYF